MYARTLIYKYDNIMWKQSQCAQISWPFQIIYCFVRGFGTIEFFKRTKYFDDTPRKKKALKYLRFGYIWREN